MKGLLALLAGIAAAAVVMMAVGYVGTSLWPLHVPADPRDPQALIEGIRAASAGAQITVLLAWFLGTFAGAAIAGTLSGAAWPGWTIGGVLAALLAFIFFVPLPVWMQTLAPISPLLGAAAADIWIKGRRAEPEPPADMQA
jgi:MFS family permease